jgi:hypothetical protein
VLVEALSVIVRNDTLEALYPGGAVGYARDCPNGSCCSDGRLTRVGFLAPEHVRAFVQRLEAHGLVFVRDGAAVDIAVVDQVHGSTALCAWLEVADDSQGAHCCWLRGAPRGPLATPAGWTAAHRLTLVTPQEQAARLTFVESREGVDVWRDDAIGRLMYTGRVGGPDAQDHLAGQLRALGRRRGLPRVRRAGDPPPVAVHKVMSSRWRPMSIPEPMRRAVSGRKRFPPCAKEWPRPHV